MAQKPGDLLKAFKGGHKKKASEMMKRMKVAHKSSKVKHTGTFEGKSNKLGHGGRAAQLKAQGVPGGVIGALARRAQAAPGQANFRSKKHKAAEPDKQELGMAFKKKRKAARGLQDIEKKTASKKARAMCKKCKGAHATNDHDADDAKKKSRRA